MRLSHKLGALCALAAVLPLLFVLVFVLNASDSVLRAGNVEQLKTNARMVATLYEKRLEAMRMVAQQLAVDIANKALVSSENQSSEGGAAMARLQDMLPRAQNDYSLDFLMVTDPTGHVIARHNDRPRAGETVAVSEDRNSLAAKVIADGSQLRNSASAGAVVESGERLARLGLSQVAQVRVGDEVRTNDALVIEAAAPIFSGGRFIGVVVVGQMLNNYYKARASANAVQTPLVTEARQAIQRNSDQDTGAVIALDGVIVASSLKATNENDRPALLGAKHTADAADERIAEGKKSYFVSWQPVKSPDGSIIGNLGAALSESEMGSSTSRASLLLPGLFAVLVAGTAGYFFGRSMRTRLDMLQEAASRMGLGELSAPVRGDASTDGKQPSFLLNDEITRLGKQMEQMRESFRQAVERLKKR